MKRPTFEQLMAAAQKRRDAHKGPMPGPKLRGRITEAQDRAMDIDVEMMFAERNLKALKPLDPDTMPDWLREAMERGDGVQRTMLIVDGRPHYHWIDAIELLEYIRKNGGGK